MFTIEYGKSEFEKNPVEIQEFKIITIRLRGIYEVYLKLFKKKTERC